MDSAATKYCVSFVLRDVCAVGMNRMVAGWNHHPIPNKGVPNDLQRRAFQTVPIHHSEVPSVGVAVRMYQQQGGRITTPSTFGQDPIGGQPALMQQRLVRWNAQCVSDPKQIFTELVSGNSQLLEDAVLKFIAQLTP